MDINVTLRRMRELVKRFEDRAITPEEYREMCELFSAMDEWFTQGGYLPSAWFNARLAGL